MLHPGAPLSPDRPAWRLYLIAEVLEGLCEALDWRDSFAVSDAYEAACRETPWGALYAVAAQEAPRSAERTASRLRALARFWPSLEAGRYGLERSEDLSLEEVVRAACGWALEAWSPGVAPVRSRVDSAAERMSRATREACLDMLARELPHALAHLKDPTPYRSWSDPAVVRARLDALAPDAFDRLSGGCPADLLAWLHAWGRQHALS
ncbi:hypothetical protein [Archangium primigenium]|uniref:hypothetical protein n=1 Tax=[Archangium] primigenium TaxID=2792470 RepID=UPI00195914F1|nr:hypothetical protein [Archangium primigenium]MBM7112690.1 hypothetical protein [Archangium primigenium]